MDAVERWIKKLAENIGVKKITFDGSEINFFQKWPRIKYEDLIKKYSPEDLNKMNTPEIDDVFKKKVRPNINEPIFLIDHPKSISPLSKSHENDPERTERFQLIIGQTELVNGFSELNDPVDQRSRMEAQEKMFREGNEEASRLDESFLEALEYGMPPTAGLGIGIDRLVALLTDTHNIRDVITFTTIKTKEN
jgi:lysyl-tRNA synthetase class 2